jgi:hypothetical protein
MRLKAKSKGIQKKASRKFKEPKVVVTDDPYNVSLQAWETLSRQIVDSVTTFPLLFGPFLRDFIEYINQMTPAEWHLFTLPLGLIYLKDLLPGEDYTEFVSLVEGIQLSSDYVLTEEDLMQMDQ